MITFDFRRVGIWHYVYQSTHHCPEDGHKSTKMQKHHHMITLECTKQQPVSQHARLSSHSQRQVGVVSVVNADIPGPSVLVPDCVLISHCQ